MAGALIRSQRLEGANKSISLAEFRRNKPSQFTGL